MRHTLKLQPYYYECAKKGTKKIELRLMDEKRRAFKVGDKIEIFKEPNLDESFTVKIKALLIYKNFEEIMEDYPMSYFGDENTTKENLLPELNKFYPIEEQEALNVVGIRIDRV